MSSKAFVIKNVDFSTNALDTVTLQNDVPCTGITLNAATLTMTAINSTQTLTATKSPVNATDSVVWSTSNATVATVANGVITQKGVGTAVITATCGSYSATCSVTATNIVDFQHLLSAYVSGRNNLYARLEAGSSGYSAQWNPSDLSGSGKKRLQSAVSGVTYAWPIELSKGASKLTFNVPSTIRATVFFVDIDTGAGGEYDGYAKWISGDTSAYDVNVPLGNREVMVPSGANAFAFSLQYPGSGNAMTDEIIAGVSILES